MSDFKCRKRLLGVLDTFGCVRTRRIGILVVVALGLAGWTPAAFAQATADILGTVTDNSGAVLPNAKVTATNVETGLVRTSATSSSGDYSFTLLPIGAYSISIEAQGFKTFTAPRVTLATGDRTRVDAQMQVGDVRQTVEVQAEAAALQTDSSTVGALVSNPANLPTNGRNFVTLVQLAPGATESVQSSLGGGGRPDDRRQTSTVSANGQTDSANNFLLDGMDNNERAIATVIVKPSIDALQEVKVDTNLYSAQLGRAGGAVINLITKSGTNNFHGTLFEFFRNDKLDAKSVFNVPQPGNPLAGVKPEFRQNQFGGSIGGPIKKDKTFFFADYEGFRRIKGLTQTATVPTACELGKATCNGVTQLGNFSDSTTPIFNPTTHAQFNNNVIPLSLISTISQNYAALYPALPSAACTGITCLFISSPNQTQYAHTGDVRIDQRFSAKDLFYARYSINNTDTVTPDYLPTVHVAGLDVHPNGGPFNGAFPSSAYQRQQSLSLSHTHIFTPSLLLQLSAQYARYVTDSESPNVGLTVNTAFGGPGNINTGLPGTSGLALLQWQTNGYAPLGDAFALPTAYWDTNYQYNGALTWSRGAHTIKFGANLLRRDWSTFQALFKANFNFNSVQTNSTAAPGGIGGNSFASMLAGYPAQDTRNMSLVAPQYRAWEIGEFIQDDWRVNRWLTLNLGLRYDIFTPFHEKHNHLSNFDPTNPAILATGQIQVAGVNGFSETAGISSQYGDVQPRIGFAASLGHGMVLRGGFGMSFWPNNIASPFNLKNAPFTANYTLNQTNGNPTLLFNNPVPAVAPAPTCLVAACGNTAVQSVPDGTTTDYKYGRVYMFNIMLEKEIAGNVFTVGYVGEPVRNLPRVIPNIDLPVPPQGPGGCGVTTAISLPNPCQPYFSQLPLVSSIQLAQTNGVSNYNALQAMFNRRLRAGLTFQAQYTYASALSDVGGPGGACGGCAQVLNDLGRDYGNSDYLVRHRFTVTASYQLPFGKSLHGVAAQAVKGWQINGIFAHSTGQPFTVLNGSSPQQNTGITTDRPNAVTPGNFTRSTSQWFDITAFRLQPFGTEGNEGHNIFFMPSNLHLDISLFKEFPITESARVQFRAESFNLTNTPAFGIPGSTISGWTGTGPTATPTSAGNFGRITTTNAFYTPRDIQFALKFIF
jgi:hypothetical protein